MGHRFIKGALVFGLIFGLIGGFVGLHHHRHLHGGWHGYGHRGHHEEFERHVAAVCVEAARKYETQARRDSHP
jgi:hypothetical protein